MQQAWGKTLRRPLLSLPVRSVQADPAKAKGPGLFQIRIPRFFPVKAHPPAAKKPVDVILLEHFQEFILGKNGDPQFPGFALLGTRIFSRNHKAGFFGHGYNNTPIYFPESSTDFIFAVFASNFGLLGVIVLLGLILYLDINIIIKWRKQTNCFSYCLT